jgi:prepilin-type N-terminal cleavage/methylation domain-containing protein
MSHVKNCLKGFTLTEVILSLAIISMIIGIALAAFCSADLVWNVENIQLELNQQARLISQKINEELLNSSKSPVTVLTPSSLRFNLKTDLVDPINYSLSGGKIIRSYKGEDKVLGCDVNSVTFCCWHATTCDSDCSDAEAVEVRLNMGITYKGKQYQLPFRTMTTLRN